MSWIKEHKSTLFYVGLGGWIAYWLFIGDTPKGCADIPNWLDIVFWAILGGMLLFMVYLMWQMRGFPENIYRYEEADQAAIREAAELLRDVGDVDFVNPPTAEAMQRVANELPTFGEPSQ